MINASKISFIDILNSGNKVYVAHKDNAKASKICFLSWIVQESLNLLSQEELCSIFLDQDIWVPLNPRWLFLVILIKSQFVSEGYIEYFSVEKLHALSKLLDSIFFYSALLLIFLYLLLELLQNYVFLELYHMLIHCHSKSSWVQVICTIIRCFITAHSY